MHLSHIVTKFWFGVLFSLFKLETGKYCLQLASDHPTFRLIADTIFTFFLSLASISLLDSFTRSQIVFTTAFPSKTL
jgi:hypothetical protein